MPPCEADGAPFQGSDAFPPWHRPTTDAPGALTFALPAEMAAPWLVRSRLREWLDGLSWPEELVDDVEYATSEAVSNVAEHAYADDGAAGPVEVHAEVETGSDGSRRLRITIRDHGRWQPLDPDPSHRGRGLFMMETLMDEVAIRRGETAEDGGTEVSLVTPAAPPVDDRGSRE